MGGGAVADLLIIVPTRGRPQAVGKVVDAWDATGAFEDGAHLVFAIDWDDPENGAYWDALQLRPDGPASDRIRVHQIPKWEPMVHKLNGVARLYADTFPGVALGFAGDDHLPRTKHWVARYLAALDQMKTGIVYGDDGFQGERLPTQWAMTPDIVRALGAMVPGGTEHLYCDNIIKTLGAEADCLRYLPEVRIEHMHPVAGKAEMDHGYSRVNAPAQYARDQRAYAQWMLHDRIADVQRVKALRGGSAGGE